MKTNYVKTEPTCCTVSGLLRHRSHTLGCMFITFVDDGGGVCHKLIFAIMAGIIVENCPPPFCNDAVKCSAFTHGWSWKLLFQIELISYVAFRKYRVSHKKIYIFISHVVHLDF